MVNIDMFDKFRIGNLRDDFLTLVNGLQIVKKKGKESWEVFDVINRIATDPNVFFLINNNDFVVLIKNDDQLWGWAFYAECGDAFGLYFDDFKELARTMGCNSIGWSTTRPAYTKLASKLGAIVTRTEYKIDIA